MLLELEVQGFALVDHTVLSFEEGLTVLTGETGAGKSIVLDSLGFLLALEPFSGSEEVDCRVAGRFRPTKVSCTLLEGLGLPADPDELLIVRERRRGGRTTSRLNGSLVSAGQLKILAPLLVDLHGQHQSYTLLRDSSHLLVLDRLAGDAHQRNLELYGKLYAEVQRLNSEISALHLAERERLRELDWMKRELQEIEEAGIAESDEDEQAEREVRRLAASSELAEGTQAAARALGQDGGSLEGLAAALHRLAPLLPYDRSLETLAERLTELEIELAESWRDLSTYAESIEHDGARLDRLQGRLEVLKRLKRRYGGSLPAVKQHADELALSIDRLENSAVHLERLERELQDAAANLQRAAVGLTERRREIAENLESEVVLELGRLAMANVKFSVEFRVRSEPGPSGSEEVRFLFSPNPGRPLVPLSETASGGELSRVMLALVAIISRHQSQPTLIFDEIDAGLGGRTAESVAARLADLAQRVQVLCVTHLPVVAAVGQQHLVVTKAVIDGRTVVQVETVAGEERVGELARMLSGDTATEKARTLALGLLSREVSG